MHFDPHADLVFDYGPALSGHANGMILRATDAQGDVILQETYYSIGGGFVSDGGGTCRSRQGQGISPKQSPLPVSNPPIEMMAMAKASGLSIAAMKRAE